MAIEEMAYSDNASDSAAKSETLRLIISTNNNL